MARQPPINYRSCSDFITAKPFAFSGPINFPGQTDLAAAREPSGHVEWMPKKKKEGKNQNSIS